MKLIFFGGILAVFIILNVLPGVVPAYHGRARHCTGELRSDTISILDSKNKTPLRITEGTKMTNGKSSWMEIGLNRIRSTTKLTVLGNCCWEIKGRDKRQGQNNMRQTFSPGPQSRTPRISYIKFVRAANRC